MLFPETVPEYTTPSTAPNVIAVPPTVPLMCKVSAGDERTIVPFKALPDWLHVSVKVPLNAPLYCPVQDPERSTAGATAVGVAGALAVVGVAVAAGALVVPATVGVGVVAPDAPQHASSHNTGVAPIIPMVRFTS
jgi:hypothetical protein